MATTDMFSRTTLGDQELKNHIVMAPMTRARGTPGKDSTLPNHLMVEYYRQRASAGLLIAEATAISEEGYGWSNAPMIHTAKHAEHWKKVTGAVHGQDGKIYVQLWHMGRQSHSSFHPKTNDVVSASPIKITTGNAKDIHGNNVDYETPRELSVEDIQETIQDYVKATRLAKEAGFDGIELHAANGYLIDQFLQSATNQRSDHYGGSMENRSRFLLEIIEAILEDGSFSASRIGVRVSPNGNYGDMGSEDNDTMFPFVAAQLKLYNLAYLHVMDGTGFGFHGKSRVVTAFDMKVNFQGPIMTNVGLTKQSAEGMIRSGAADLVAFGRLYTSNPDLVERLQNDWPLNPFAAYEDWWAPNGAKGYTDFPVYDNKTHTINGSTEPEKQNARAL